MGSRLSRYRIDALIGRGGMGDVHRAFDTLLRRDVALKVLHTGSGRAADDARARLLREARLGAALAHPNVVMIHDLGEDDDGDAFIVMELAVGQTLRQIMRSKVEVEIDVKLRWLAEIASALEAAHAAGLVHRDIKPENVVITRNRTVKVLDFGIAKIHGGEPTSGIAPAAPPSIGIAGTPAYMAPEQWRGEVDARADQYAWGIMAYELLSGQRPGVAIEGQPVQRGTLRSLTEVGVPPEIDVVIARATAERPLDRFATLTELLAAWPRSSDRIPEGTPATRIEVGPKEVEKAAETTESFALEASSLEGSATLTAPGGATLVMADAPTVAAGNEPSNVEHLETIESASTSRTRDRPDIPPAPTKRGRRWAIVAAGFALFGTLAVWTTVRQARPPSSPRTSADPVAPAASEPEPLVVMAGDQGMVRVGPSRSCALLPDRTLSCWGGGSPKPTTVEGLSGVFEFSIGRTHVCALATSSEERTKGDVYCWGSNDHGQLGDGTTAPSTLPKRVALPGPVGLVAASSTHTCAMTDRESGDLYCWGNNDVGQLGDGTTTPSLVPKRVAFADGAKALRFGIGHDLGCAVLRPGLQLWCWGRNDDGQAGQDPARVRSVLRPTVVSGLPTVSGVFPGVRHVCAREAATRELWCWGANDRGQLGVGTVSPWERPKHVAIPAIDTMRGGLDGSCALLLNPGRQVRGRCWGSNDQGQLGIEPVGRDQPSPVEAPAIDGAFEMKMASHACKVDNANGTVWCWGRNDEHQLGDGTGRSTAVPVRVRR
ncbi:MAG: protein kinase [Deltaproteobacteria bacterium]|nr:protein kinase [Deltaproteobacteria bacterium]